MVVTAARVKWWNGRTSRRKSAWGNDTVFQLLLRKRMASLESCGQLLNALSHRGVLARGFALVRDLKGKPLREAAAVHPGSEMDIEFFDGRVRAWADQSSTAAARRQSAKPQSKHRGSGGGDTGQGSLFG